MQNAQTHSLKRTKACKISKLSNWRHLSKKRFHWILRLVSDSSMPFFKTISHQNTWFRVSATGSSQKAVVTSLIYNKRNRTFDAQPSTEFLKAPFYFTAFMKHLTWNWPNSHSRSECSFGNLTSSLNKKWIAFYQRLSHRGNDDDSFEAHSALYKLKTCKSIRKCKLKRLWILIRATSYFQKIPLSWILHSFRKGRLRREKMEIEEKREEEDWHSC